jgi:queuine tRNA-ribosyltransferase
MSRSFHIDASCGAARAGRLITPHGEIETPVFMPVGTLGSIKGVPQEILEELDAQIILANTYHLYLRPGAEQIRSLGGLHHFMSWPRPLLTDSGGYQVFSLSQLRKVSEEGVHFRSHLDGSSHLFTPENTIDTQIALGADIIMAFDECTEYPADRKRARDSMELTARWAERCKRHFDDRKNEVPWRLQHSALSSQHSASEGSRFSGEQRNEGPAFSGNSNLETGNSTQALFGIVQGGTYADLRRESAERTVALNFPGYAIGGLSVGEPRELREEILAATLPLLPADKPRYVMGVGTPEEITRYALMGADMMDCVLPTRAARHGLLYTSAGKVNIKNACYASDDSPPDPNCKCCVCRRYSRAYLRHLYTSGELLAQTLNTIHNLACYLDTMRAVRQSIILGAGAPVPSVAAGRASDSQEIS